MTNEGARDVDERFYFEIWAGWSDALTQRDPSVYYCENHNGDLDFDLAATDFQIAAEALITVQREQPIIGNWAVPLLHLVRQTAELRLKALAEIIGWKTGAATGAVKFDHNLEKLWSRGRIWLISSGYPIESDARLAATDRLIENLHHIDPSGDLFRFGTSRKVAFGRQKSSDRVGFNHDRLFSEFEQTCGCLSHWHGVLMRELIQNEQGWEDDPYFDKDAFPKANSESN